ncbi:bifunctional proline dehydrogenase/L-glutamate gamma-semialdehyde dehydrogenase [Hoyosella subflava]|uniref:L-glutamate gamma-semialdehyde dehydrogenase n=1 Tax=Hoyosella subflava (strain DSM 45089 / JCM 17490 / NBRC 109087 / DQS3-9A1) TaxID=443218 RepID=F6EJT8_HOYSD|nr:bifunctional proline dehydrogenase/L-glutamate gamma-semialdehyde dehydrogenase [Hoyosella subflava]AEF40113.1 bifunctional proline dehydrogenase/pyrroline-5-carboxylate dehydrogenase [Hoyosella subflava DQS3-9A1]
MSTIKDNSAAVLPQDLTDEAIQLVRHWLTEGAKYPVDRSAEQLAGVLNDPNGLDFTVGFVDGVIRPEDPRVAAANLKALAPKVPAFLPWYMKLAVTLGGILAVLAPKLVIPVTRKVLRHMVGHLIVDATDAKLGKTIGKIKRDGIHLNINLLGEAILGESEAARRLDGTRRLLARDDVDYVSIKVSSTVAPHNHWAFDEAVTHVVENLTPLYRQAANASPKRKFINLDMEEYKDLDLTIAVFTELLDKPEFRDLEAGIVLQAYLPDALPAMIHLQQWASDRVATGGAPIKVRVVKGANLPMEMADAELHGWPLATWHTKRQSDTSYKAVLNYALRPEHTRNVRIGVAGHNLFDVALAWLLAQARGVTDGIEFEMLLGMATGQAEAVRKDVGSLLLYTPVVHPREFDVAIAYLIRRLEEGASKENFMSAVFELDKNEALFEREKQRFIASVNELTDDIPEPHRIQDRREPQAPGLREGFKNTPDTDPDLPGNRAWGRDIAERMQTSQLGIATSENNWVGSAEELDTIMSRGVSAAEEWQSLGANERAAILHRAGDVLESKRADLLEVMGAECGKTIDQGDPEVSEAIDFAHYYAERGRDLEHVDGAQFVPSKLTVVTPPWNFPTAIPAGSTLSALASGSAVVIKPAHQAKRTGAVMVEALWEAGVPRDVLQYVQLGERELGAQFVSHPSVDRLILTGAYDTAKLFRSFRRDLPLLAETSGKNAIIVTPSADYDLAAKDVAYSAFGHAGQKCSAASLVILVGSVATSQRFRNQLLDAVRSLKVGSPWDLQTQVGPVIEPAQGKLLRGLTTLGEGESWVIKPKQLDELGKVWSPGIREGVKRGSEYHMTEYFGPILGIMTAPSLEEAVNFVNDIEYGLTSGLHSLDRDEVAYWLSTVEAGNLYINRGITGAIVQRQPFGGWKKSAIGAGTKAGGPNYLIGMGTWLDSPVSTTGDLGDTQAALLSAVRNALSAEDVDWLRDALSTDAAIWTAEFGRAQDKTGLQCERNLLRYRPVPVTVRYEAASSGHGAAELVRVVAAGLQAASVVTVSSSSALPEQVKLALTARGVTVEVEDNDQWAAHVARLAARTGPHSSVRIRLIGGDYQAAAEAAEGKPDVAIYAAPVVSAGRVELLPFLHEQAVSITAHRYGTPNHLTEGLI